MPAYGGQVGFLQHFSWHKIVIKLLNQQKKQKQKHSLLYSDWSKMMMGYDSQVHKSTRMCLKLGLRLKSHALCSLHILNM